MQQVAIEAAPVAWVLNGYPWWVHVGVILLTGIFGGLLNAILSGGPTYGIRLGRLSAGENSGMRMLHLGVWGSILVGIGAALAAWGTGFHQTPLPAMIAGCLFAGLAGANYLTSRAQQAAAEETARNQGQAIGDLLDAVEETRATGSTTNPPE